jgi:serine/threonine protein kinase
MSPEQAHGEVPVDARTDVWALGAVLFEMLAGRPPYEGTGRAHKTILRVMTEPAPRLEKVAPWVPPAVARIVNAALMKDRERRIPDCASFADLLLQALPGRASKPPRARTDDEVTRVAPSPTSSGAIDIEVSMPGARPPMLTTPLPEGASPYATPLPPAPHFPSSHIRHARVTDDIAFEQTALLITPLPPALIRTTTTSTVATRRRGRGMLGMLALSMILAAATLIGGHVGRAHLPLLRTYAAAPFSR